MLFALGVNALTATTSAVGVGLGFTGIDLRYLIATSVVTSLVSLSGLAMHSWKFVIYGQGFAVGLGSLWFLLYGRRQILSMEDN